MKKRDDQSETAAEPRLSTEEEAARSQESLEVLSPEEARKKLHELRVRQIELEMQNEELRRVQVELEASRMRYFGLYDMAPVGYVTLSEQGLILEANLTAATQLDVPREELAGQMISRFIFKEDLDIYYHHRAQLFETGKPQVCELRMMKKDGMKFWGHLTANAAQNTDGAIVCGVTMSDVTEYKRSELLLKESEERHRYILRTTRDGVWITDMQGHLLEVNSAYCRMSGYSEQELLSMRYSDLHAPESAFDVETRIQKLMVQGEDRFETRHRRKDGSIFDVEVSSIIIPIEGGRVIVFLRDITDRKRAELLLKESEERHRTILRTSMDGIWIADMQGHLREVNDAYCLMTGYSEAELLAMRASDLEAVSSASDRESNAQKLVEQGKGSFETRLRRKDGGVFDVEANVIYLPIEGGRFVAFHRDITDRKRAEADLLRTAESIKLALAGTVQALSMTVEIRDPYTAGHQKRVADLAGAIATEMGMDNDQVDSIRLAGSIHDLGKISVPAEILSKPGKLSETEFSLIKTHPGAGYEILKDIEFPLPIADIILQHHERIDGSGYPNGLKGDEILPGTRILAVSDVVEAMASHRPYRPSRGIEAALEEIEKNRGVLYDTAVVDACLLLFRKKRYQLPEAGESG